MIGRIALEGCAAAAGWTPGRTPIILLSVSGTLSPGPAPSPPVAASCGPADFKSVTESVGSGRQVPVPSPVRAVSRRALWVICALWLLPGLLLACGGRSSAPPLAEPVDVRTISDADSIEPAVRIDRSVRPRRIGDDQLADPVDDKEAGDPPPGVTYHLLQRGETLYSLARAHGVPLATLMQVNGITDPTRVPAGAAILIPSSPMDAGREAGIDRPDPGPATETRRPGSSGKRAAMGLVWPLGGRITAGFGGRGKRSHHEGIDIDGYLGQEVRAAAAGEVIRAGTDGKYGKVVVIDHGDGLTTLYAHASRLLVRAGDRVEKHDPIAEVGRSGNARGTHLHFEMRRNGQPVDPLPLLRGGAVHATGRD
jgi:LysM repeat protein